MKHRQALARQGGEVVKKAIAVVVMVVLSFATACAAAAPTPSQTPEPTATPAEVRATEAEHLAGIWFIPAGRPGDSALYFRWEADGTARRASTLKGLEQNPTIDGRFWFEDGAFYVADDPNCEGVGVYEVYLRIQEGRAVGLRMKVIEASDPSCPERRLGAEVKFVRADW
jgi:hypothetical protein